MVQATSDLKAAFDCEKEAETIMLHLKFLGDSPSFAWIRERLIKRMGEDIAICDRVQSILQQLIPEDRQTLEIIYLHGKSREYLARVRGYSKLECRAALQRAVRHYDAIAAEIYNQTGLS